jgi:hypothetical protein
MLVRSKWRSEYRFDILTTLHKMQVYDALNQKVC